MKKPTKREQELQRQIDVLQIRFAEAEETLRAIREGEVDAVVVSGTKGEQIFSLVGTDSIYRSIVETMKEAAFTVTFDGRILFCNGQFSQLVKRSLEQVVGHPLQEFVVQRDQAAAASLLVAAQQQPVKQRLVFQATDGTDVPAHVAANVLNQPDGLSICVVANDLTELENSTELIQQLRRHQEAMQAANEELAATEEELRVQNEELAASRAELDRTRARYQDLFETAPDGYLVTDPEGTIQEVNQAAAHLLGRPAAELRGNPFSSLLPASQWDGYLRVMATLHAGTPPPPKWEVEVRPMEGPPFWAAVTAAASRDEEGRIVGLRWLVRDVSDRKRAEETIKRHTAILAGINSVFEAVIRAQTEEELGHVCLEVAEKLTQSPFGFIGEINPEGLEDIAISNPGWDACKILAIGGHRATGGNFKIHGIYGRVLQDGKSLLTNDPAHHPDSIGLPTGHPPLESFLGVPLIHDGKTIGIVAVGNRQGGYSQDELKALEALAAAIVEAFLRKRAEEALQESEEKYRTIVETANEGIWVVDVQTSTTYVNRRMAEMLGYLAEEMIGHSFTDFMDEEDRALIEEKFERRKHGIPESHEQKLIRKDGSPLWVISNATPLKDKNGRFAGSLGMVTDITERKRAEKEIRESKQRLQFHFENSPLAVVEWDANFAVIQWSKEAERTFGWKSEETLGQRIDALNMIHLEDLPIVARTMERLTSGKELTVVSSNRNLTKSGAVIECTWYNSVLVDPSGKIISVMSLVEDITDRKRAEESLCRAAEELERSNKDLQAFAYVASHDLQEPLRMVMSFLSLLEEQYKGQLDAKALGYIGFAVEGATRMSALIRDLLDYSRVSSKGKKLAPVDMSAVAEKARASLQVGIAESNAILSIDPLPTVMADPIQMSQLFQNLVDNAIKFCPKDRRPEVHIGAQREGGEYVFRVKDNGIGVPPEEQDRVFAIFQRLHTREEYPGTGIGLAICKKIVERHGGRIWVESDLERGSTFCFTLPAG